MNSRSKLLRAFDRDLAAEKAATMFRKGSTAAEVCTALRLSESAVRELAADYGFSFPMRGNSMWPAADHPGERGRELTAMDVWARARQGARETMRQQAIS